MDCFVGKIDESIEAYLSESGVTKAHLAKDMGITYDSLRNKRQGKQPWLMSEVIMLAGIIGKNVSDFI